MSSRGKWIVVAAVAAVPLLFAAFTQHAWEDYFITLRSSRNLVLGQGLVFTPGERLHTFTSPLGVLLPALCSWIVGPGHEAAALWLFRALNIGLLGAAAALVWRRSETLGLGSVGRVTIFGLLFLDAKLVDFATNGMETALLVFFALLLWSELERDGPLRGVRIGAVAGALMWTRPDAFVLVAALVLPHLLWRVRATSGEVRTVWRPLVVGAGIAATVYLPWLAFATWYYGSPVPHTIVAKSALTPPPLLKTLLLTPWYTLSGQSMLGDLFLPTYWPQGGWPSRLPAFGYVLTTIAAFAWLIPTLAARTRRASLALFIGMFYLCAIVLFPWYSPPWTAIAAIALGGGADDASRALARRGIRWATSALRVGVLCAVLVQAAVLLATTWEMHVQQRLIEQGVRRSIGEWLHDHASPGDSVFLEPLGYIGYYSQLKMLDYPGLSSREVTAAIRGGAHRFAEIIAQVRPTWLVLRPAEIADPSRPENATLRDYELVRTWNVRPEVDAVAFLPGRPWIEHDAEFRVFHRRASAPAAVPSVRAD